MEMLMVCIGVTPTHYFEKRGSFKYGHRSFSYMMHLAFFTSAKFGNVNQKKIL
jgi:hypothetical protein